MQTLHEQERTIPVLQEQTIPVLPLVKQTQHEEQTAAPEHALWRQTRGKRFVSKRRCAANAGKVIALSSVSLGFLLVASLTLLWTLLSVSIWRMPAGHQTDFGSPEEMPPWILGCAAISLLSYFLAWRTLHKAIGVEIGVPLTRANTADLPAPDSLVRACEEPRQAQEAVLLRASVGTQEGPEEQLLRASASE